jgi:CspA family cold shock protein
MAMIDTGRNARRDMRTQTAHTGNHNRQHVTRPENKMGPQTGKVKWFSTRKKYGWIRPDDGSKEVFVHITAVEAAGMVTLVPDQKLHFEIGPGKDSGTQATKLRARL